MCASWHCPHIEVTDWQPEFLESSEYKVISLQSMNLLRHSFGFLFVNHESFGCDIVSRTVEKRVYVPNTEPRFEIKTFVGAKEMQAYE